MSDDRRSWLDRLLQRSAKTDVSSLAFQPAGNKQDGTVVPVSFAIVPGSAALGLLQELHTSRPDKHAFLLGSPDKLSYAFEVYEDMQAAADSLRQAEQMTVESWRAEKAEELKQLLDEHPEWEDLEEGAERGDWPDNAEPQSGFLGPRDILSGGFQKEVVIGLSPASVDRWWETAAHLRFGGWNDCPSPAVHVMLHKLWSEKYGARLVTMAFDTIELSIERPIKSREEALEVAQLQYEYCNDIIDQGAETLENLAASLIGATTWYFWWD